jgi:hypothetical protein
MDELALVPVQYAEKAMASLLQMHAELSQEKERRIDLYRRLMEKEQALAELRSYVKLLEARAPAPASKPTPPPAPKLRPPLQARAPSAAGGALSVERRKVG